METGSGVALGGDQSRPPVDFRHFQRLDWQRAGLSQQLVGEIASRIRRVRPPEPYKGKGIRYAGEQVKRKVGKRA